MEKLTKRGLNAPFFIFLIKIILIIKKNKIKN